MMPAKPPFSLKPTLFWCSFNVAASLLMGTLTPSAVAQTVAPDRPSPDADKPLLEPLTSPAP
ncbi:MAG: hypothetical protein O2890_04840, partial [Cyanobacteria bacterium]|nr:hypothetical protein [Cyanobacteriota bacterium]